MGLSVAFTSVGVSVVTSIVGVSVINSIDGIIVGGIEVTNNVGIVVVPTGAMLGLDVGLLIGVAISPTSESRHFTAAGGSAVLFFSTPKKKRRPSSVGHFGGFVGKYSAAGARTGASPTLLQTYNIFLNQNIIEEVHFTFRFESLALLNLIRHIYLDERLWSILFLLCILSVLRVLRVFLRVTSVLLFLRTILRGPRAEIILVFVVSPWRRAASASIMGCGGRMPTTQHIAVTVTPWATRRYAGSRPYDHHSQRKLTLMVPYFFVTFLMVL